MISWCLYLCLLDVVCLWLFMFVLMFIGLFALFWLFALVVWCLIVWDLLGCRVLAYCVVVCVHAGCVGGFGIGLFVGWLLVVVWL